MTLRRAAKLSGMSAHCDFTEQESFESETGRLRPDMMINLPGERRIAWLLGTTTTERETVFDKARRIYNERSKVVHGQSDATSAKNFAVCGEAEEMNRQLLVRAMRRPNEFTVEKLKKVLLGA
jgi:RmuC family